MEGRDNNSVSIIIVNWNQRELLKKCLKSLKNKTLHSEYTTIVVDNGSQDNSAKMVKRKFEKVDIIENDRNLGFSKGNNVGIKYALENYDPNFLLLLNNDTEIIQEGWLKNLVRVGSHENVGIVGCKLLNPNGSVQQDYDDGISEEDFIRLDSSNYGSVMGACFLIKRELFEIIGFLDTGFSPYLYEESDYCMRCYQSGYDVVYTPRSKIVHYGGASIDPEHNSHSDLEGIDFYYYVKNKIRHTLLNFKPYEIIGRIGRVFWKTLFHTGKTEKYINLSFDLRNNANERFNSFLKGLWTNIKNVEEIIEKRLNRTMKIEYE